MTKKAFVMVGGCHGGGWGDDDRFGDPVGGPWLVPILRDIVLIDIVEEKEKPAYSRHGGDN
tara:strand:- start:6246 stop:6428 length:183 start_codon:yes stop_codon:yes gene_type:complete